MAAIEKSCEFSGDYDGHKMYKYKKNSIQIMPKYRKLFKNKKAVLKFLDKDYLIKRGKDFYLWSNKENHNEYKSLLAQGYSKEDAAYFALGSSDSCPAFDYNYELIVKHPELQGEVKGVYANDSHFKGKVRRKLQRLVGGKRFLKIS